jgi:hypothetical protein
MFEIHDSIRDLPGELASAKPHRRSCRLLNEGSGEPGNANLVRELPITNAMCGDQEGHSSRGFCRAILGRFSNASAVDV